MVRAALPARTILAMGLSLNLVAISESAEGVTLSHSHSVTPTSFLNVVEEMSRFHESADTLLTESQIAWVLEAEASLRSQGMTVPRQEDRFRLIGHAYYQRGVYGNAMEFFFRIGDWCKAEEALWLWRHHDLQPPFFVTGEEAY